MKSHSTAIIGTFLMVLLSGASGCERCSCGCEPDHLAELVEIQGSVERDWASRLNEWTSAKQKDVFYVGDGVRAKKKSQAVLKLSEGSYARLKAESMIRFLLSKDNTGKGSIDLQEGEAEIEVGNEKLSLFSTVGLAELEANSRVRIRKSKEGLDFYVRIGTAVFQTPDEKPTVVTAGEGIQIGIGTAILTRYVEEPPTKPGESTEPPSEPKPKLVSSDQISIHVRGEGVRVQPSDGSPWRELSPGISNVIPQSILKLPPNTSVKVQRDQDSAVLFGEGKFKVGKLGGPLIHTWSGKIDVESNANDLSVVVPGGIIIADSDVEGPSRASINVHNKSTSIEVQEGIVEVRQQDHIQKLTAGQRVSIGGQKVIRNTVTHKEFKDTGPDYADLRVNAGETFVIHTAKPPVAIEFLFRGKCQSGGGIAQLLGKNMRSQGMDSARLLVQRGTSRYVVRCVDEQGMPHKKPTVAGRVTVIRDAGTARLPRKAPLSSVDADGRVYTILYQNQLPSVRVGWLKPPKSSSYMLHVTSSRRKKTKIALKKPLYTFKSGSLRDGTHQLRFNTSDSSTSSKTTSIKILFDNAAPKISLSSPKDLSFQAGQEVSVNGVAVPGWKISLIDGTISMDEQHRFSGNVTYTGKYQSITLRITHPRRGIHYYLRRGRM